MWGGGRGIAGCAPPPPFPRQLWGRARPARWTPPWLMLLCSGEGGGRASGSPRAGGGQRFDSLLFLVAACAPRPSPSAGRPQGVGGGSAEGGRRRGAHLEQVGADTDGQR